MPLEKVKPDERWTRMKLAFIECCGLDEETLNKKLKKLAREDPEMYRELTELLQSSSLRLEQTKTAIHTIMISLLHEYQQEDES